MERMEKCVEEIRRRFGKDSIRNGVLCQNLRLPPEKAEITMPTGMVGYGGLNVIDEKEVTAYVAIPDCFLQGCSEDIVIFRADGGNHFTDYGIYEGMFLFFDRKKRFKKGRLSCYINTAGDDRPKYRVSDKNIDGYKHLGRLVLTLRNYEE